MNKHRCPATPIDAFPSSRGRSPEPHRSTEGDEVEGGAAEALAATGLTTPTPTASASDADASTK
eukprot:14497604-Alexandrium_andersonii.AAC.1